MPIPPLRFETIGDVMVVHYSGTAGELLPPGTGLLDFAERGVKKFVIDFEGVPILSSFNLGPLLTLIRKTRSHGVVFRVSCPDKTLREVLEITKLDRLFPVFDSMDKALAGF